MDEFNLESNEELEPTQPAGTTAGEPSIGDAFADMENDLSDGAPEGSFVTLRSGGNTPRFAPIYEGETAVPIRVLADRAGLTFGGSINIFVDGNQVNFDYAVPAGTTVNFVGNVKGG